MDILEEIQSCSVEWKELWEVCSVNKGKQLNKSLLTDDGLYPAYNGGQTFSGRTNDYNVEANTIIVSQGGASAGFVNFVETRFWANAHCYYILPDENRVNNRFVYHFVKMNQKYLMDFQHGAGIPALKSDKLTKLLIPISPLEIQEKIVQILDKMTEYVTELTSELTSRKKQYSYYRDKLLSFEDEVYQVEWKTLSEIAKDFGRGKSKHRPRNDARLYGGDIPFIQTGDIREAGKWIENFSQTYSDFGLEQSKQWEKGTLCITIAANIAETGLLGFDACFPDSVIGFVANPEFAFTEYVYYYLNSIKDYLANKSYGSAQDNLNLSSFSSLKIPVPSLGIQSRIVQVLDNFDTVCHDLNIGLPKEIELRQKQYEFFREKLLTFTAEGVYPDSGQWTVAWAQSDLIKLLNWVFGPIRVELGQIFNTKNGYTPTKTNLDNWRNGTIPWFRMEDIRENGGILSDSIQHITEGAVKGELFPANSIIIATSATIGYHALVTRKFLANQRFTCLLAKEGISGLFIPNFLYYYCFKLDEFCRQNTLQGNFATVDMTKFKKFKFIIPSIKRQREIISILDHFNTLTTSLSEGLPKEIELRQKQYEYWREQLLNFTR